MDVLYYLSGFAVLLVIIAMIVGAIKPTIFTVFLKKFASRKYILIGGLVLVFLLGGVASATEPDHIKQARLEREQAAQQAKQAKQQEEQARRQAEEEARNKETTQEVSETQKVSFESQTKDDASLPKGQTKVVQEGQDGEKTIVYTVAYKGGTETSRAVKSESVTKQSIPKVTAVGTYVAPAPSVSAPSSSGGGYTNSQGNYVPSPSSNPAGATARCRDGTYSYSQSRRGTCSHHGGVATWL